MEFSKYLCQRFLLFRYQSKWIPSNKVKTRWRTWMVTKLISFTNFIRFVDDYDICWSSPEKSGPIAQILNSSGARLFWKRPGVWFNQFGPRPRFWTAQLNRLVTHARFPKIFLCTLNSGLESHLRAKTFSTIFKSLRLATRCYEQYFFWDVLTREFGIIPSDSDHISSCLSA